ncbi:MAG TPA: penicillin-binding transpeptidase domain-containing protein, partial [Nitrospira sp.]|nr:penicillin-binding transpeptidase domain-containing protein [Nitrospira sp.]
QNMKVNCTGGATFYGRYFKCWISHRHQMHGITDVTKGIYQSCDVFFYTLAEKLGIDKISKWAEMLGLGHRTGIDLPQEVSGVMPSEEWKIRNFHQKWFAGETISVGIGQGAIAATPVQMARAIGAIATDGHLVRPHVVDLGELPGDAQAHYKQVNAKIPDVTSIPIDPSNWEVVTDAMRKVVSPLGTAALSQIPGIDFGGKTGSAQTVSNAFKERLGKSGAEEYKDNGWFVGVAPTRNPDIVVAVLYQSGEHGDKTAPIAAQLIKAFVQKRRRVLNDVAYDAPQPYAPVHSNLSPADETGTPVVKTVADQTEAVRPKNVTGNQVQGSTEPEKKDSQPTRGLEPGGMASSRENGSIDMAAVWTDGGEDHHLESAKFAVPLKGTRKRATAAPGMR